MSQAAEGRVGQYMELTRLVQRQCTALLPLLSKNLLSLLTLVARVVMEEWLNIGQVRRAQLIQTVVGTAIRFAEMRDTCELVVKAAMVRVPLGDLFRQVRVRAWA